MIKIKAFGKIAEMLDEENLELTGLRDTSELKTHLEMAHPALKNMSYQIALDRKIVAENTSLEKVKEVALLPPFSGG
jgi:sulfur-carrier protein